MLDKLKIAIVADWLTVYAGAERVVYEMHKLFPNAPIYTSLYNEGACPLFKDANVRESGLRFLPFARRMHKIYMPLMPGAFERMDLSEYDIVLSSNHSASKGVITKPGTLHISYCHSPMRYVWDQSHAYVRGFKFLSPLGFFYKPVLHRIRMWDRVAADRVDSFIANSDYVGRRIEKYYDRKSEIIHPPVDLQRFSPAGHGTRDYYLALGRLIPYKRFDLAVEAFNKLGKPLKIVGRGYELGRLKRMAKGNVEFLWKVSDSELREIYQNAKALIFPQMEDFGIVPLEAMACGTPVIAYGQGGALETVKDGKSGIFFKEQTAASLVKAVKAFEKKRFSPEKVAETVKSFSSARFQRELRHFVEKAWKEHKEVIG